MFQLMFQMIDQNRQLIYFKTFDREFEGIEGIQKMNKDIENLFKSLNHHIPDKKKENFHKAFWKVIEDFQNSSHSYMKTIHNLLKIINQNCLDYNKETYADLVRSQFNTEELKFILYNGIASDDFASFKINIEKYGILKDLALNPNIDAFLKRQYQDSAYEIEKYTANPCKKRDYLKNCVSRKYRGLQTPIFF